jgi:type IV pilus assembly protein PilQ
MNRFVPVLGLALCTLLALPAKAQSSTNSLESVTAAQQAGHVVFRATFKEPLATVPANFSVAQPARIAFDLPDTINGLGRNSETINEGEVRSATFVQAGNRMRLVLNLSNPMTYDATVDGRVLSVTLATNIGATARSKKAERFAEDDGNSAHAIRDIDFRRGPAGEGRIVVELADTSTGIDIRQQGPNLVVDFAHAQLPENLRKRLNVTDFGTPVQNINAFPQGGNVRLLIEPKGLWEHNAYQTDRQFVVEVKPVVYDPNKLTQGSRGGYKGEKLSLNFQNIDVRSVLNVIADFTDLNIITSDTVQGNLTLRLKDVPWDQALDIILQTRGLDMRKNGNVIWIAPRDELATKEKLELEARQQINDLEPLRTETFQLNYTKAEDLIKVLTDEKQKMLSKRGSAVVDARTNQIFVQDIAPRLDEIRRIVAAADIPVRQVMIEARIVEASDNFGRTLGARLGLNTINPLQGGGFATGGNSINTGFQTNQPFNPQPNLGGPIPNFPSTSPVSATPTTPANPGDLFNVNLPATRTSTGAAPGQFALSLFNAGLTRFLNLELNALESDGKGKIISSPRVVTANQTEASIEQGTEIPYQQSTSSGATAVAFKKAVLSLKVKPQITPDGNVIVEVTVHKDSVGAQLQAGVAIDTKNVVTSVLIDNGGTVVIGGIYTQNELNQVNKVPLLGDVPGLGFFFRNTFKQDNKTELLVFITPRIVDDRLSIR